MSLRSWSAYELAEQMKRGMAHVWPRAERAIYYEPKHLVERGLATAEVQTQGRRKRTVYSITPEGLAAVRAWLKTTPEPPRIENEVLLHLGFAEYGTPEDMRRALAVMEGYADELLRFTSEQARDYLAEGGPFPKRLHLIALWGRFLFGYGMFLREFARDTASTIEEWDDTTDPEVWPGWRDEMSGWIERLEEARDWDGP